MRFFTWECVINCFQKLCVIIVIAYPTWHQSTANAAAASFDKSMPDAEALNAYKKFWDAFTLYEKSKNTAASAAQKEAVGALDDKHSTVDKASTESRINALGDSARKYRENLTSIPSSNHRPFVLINLAQVYAELSFLQGTLGLKEARENQQNAISVLTEVERDFPDFSHLTEALYLKAALLESLDDRKAAKLIWTKLAKKGGDRFAFHACLVLGDHDFENASPENALVHYTRAQSMLTNLDQEQQPVDLLRVYYRIAWAQFKKGDHGATLKAIRDLIKPGNLAQSSRNRETLLSDLADLAAYSLFAINNNQSTFEFLKAPNTTIISATTAVKLMTQYLDSNRAVMGAEIGVLASMEFPLEAEYPDILQTKAKCEAAAGLQAARQETLEKLGMLLPTSSLWRQRHLNNTKLLDHMEDLARNASESVASQYYQQGLASGSAKKFLMAATYYKILLEDAPNSEKSSTIRLNIANSLFFAERLIDAERSYNELVSDLKTPEDVLMIAQYQLVLTLEKLWRRDLELALQKRSLGPVDQLSLSRLGHLERAVEDYANRFPAQFRTVDLLLVAASANRDQARFPEANRFWQRALLSNPGPGQRAIAIRGIIFTKIREGNANEIIEAASNFLKLENTDPSFDGLRKELLGVISTAASDEASMLSKKGLTEEAGTLLLRVVSDFPSLPNRELLWRDGAYFVAISGNWQRAQASAENFLKGKFHRFRGDMIYLTARSHEYQLRFARAVKAYLELAKTSPEHQRAKISLERAEKLALADNDFSSAGEAALGLTRHEQNSQKKLALYDASIKHFTDAGKTGVALKIADTRKKHSSTTLEKLRAEFLIARLRIQSGDKQTGLDDLDTLAKQIDRNKSQLGGEYKLIAADVNMEIGEQLLKQFLEIPVMGQKRPTIASIEKKSLIFSDLTKRLDKVSSLELIDLSPKARFLIGKSATDFADEITAIPNKSGEPLALRNQTRFNQDVTRLRDLAQRYHGNNILAKQRYPQQYSRNEWISKSALAVSGGGGNVFNTGLHGRSDQLSTASSLDAPLQWSH